jgi:hypothetical protein
MYPGRIPTDPDSYPYQIRGSADPASGADGSGNIGNMLAAQKYVSFSRSMLVAPSEIC